MPRRLFNIGGMLIRPMTFLRRCELMRFNVILFAAIAFAASFADADDESLTRESVIRGYMRPFEGPATHGVDCSTMTGKVLCGYQGWFTTPTDGADRGWFHWSHTPENFTAKIDLWPDVSELD